MRFLAAPVIASVGFSVAMGTDILEVAPSNATRVRPLAFTCLGIAYDVDLPGNDLVAEREDDYRRCATRCYEHDLCVGFTWTDHDGGTCWLKSGYGKGTAVYKAGAKSGVTSQRLSSGNCPREYVVIANCDMPGNDMYSVEVPGQGYDACYPIANEKGYFYTWSDHNGGTCWIKPFSTACVYAPNKYSGFVTY